MSITKNILIDHLRAEFESATPVWVAKDSLVFSALENSIVETISDVLFEHFENSDFFNSALAKIYKQNDYMLIEHLDNVDIQFKRKMRTIFRRGTLDLDYEVARLFRSIDDTLYYETYLYYDKLFSKSSVYDLKDSRTLLSGWIADVTYPSINLVETHISDETSCEFLFSEKDFVSLTAVNNTDFSSEFLSEFIKRYLFPFQLISSITFKTNENG